MCIDKVAIFALATTFKLAWTLTDYPEFKPTGNYMLETPFFNMEKFKKDFTAAFSCTMGEASFFEREGYSIYYVFHDPSDPFWISQKVTRICV